jgi:CRISPR-associated protein Csx17
MFVHELTGCRSTPLASYLKALGILRLVTEQADTPARGWWEGRTFRLETALGEPELDRFFLDDYRPSPLVAPWNGGSGFAPKDQQSGIESISKSSDPRLAVYRKAIAEVRTLVAGERWAQAAAGKTAKRDLVQLCRAELSDEVVLWIDAAVVLTSSRTAFPPLLGTGGNVGRLEFSNNFMQRLVAVLGLPVGSRPPSLAQRKSWLRGSLWDEPTAGVTGAPIGQFDPGGAGGANSGPHGDAGSVVNPWDYVLLLEGALAFSSGAARRMGSTGGESMAATPFMFRSSPEGFGSAATDETTKGELWAPVWSAPSRWPELARMLSEGRGAWGRRQARSGLDFVRAIASLGVDRGIDRFERFVFAERHGQNMLAIPAGSVSVQERPGVRLLQTVDAWIGPLRYGAKPASVATGLRRFDAAQYDVARRSDPESWQELLTALAALELVVARPTRDRLVNRPITGLMAKDWIPLLDDGSAEWDVAATLASGIDRQDNGGVTLPSHYLRPVQIERGRHVWRDGSIVPSDADVLVRLAGLFQRRLMEADVCQEDRVRGVHPGFVTGRPARAASLAALLQGELDPNRLGSLLDAALLLDWREARSGAERTGQGVPASAGFCLAAPFVAGKVVSPQGSPSHVACDPAWGRLLARGDVTEVLTDMIHRLRLTGFRVAVVTPRAAAWGIDARGLAAALMAHVNHFVAARQLKSVLVRERVPQGGSQ